MKLLGRLIKNKIFMSYDEESVSGEHDFRINDDNAYNDDESFDMPEDMNDLPIDEEDPDKDS